MNQRANPKWCTHCERPLSRDYFYVDPRGWVSGRCLICRRYFAKMDYRRKARSRAYLAAEAARKRAAYAANPEPKREAERRRRAA